MPALRPLCFVAMPFGSKSTASRTIEFDVIYRELIAPAIEAAGLQPLRADEERAGGIIHKPMFERLLLCEYAIGDLTMDNANVYYEIGVRHTAKPRTTVLIAANEIRLPFDVAPLRTVVYRLDAGGKPSHVAEDRAKLAAVLESCKRERRDDSPLYQLLDGMQPPRVDSDRTDSFREQVAEAEAKKSELALARKAGIEAVRRVRESLGAIEDVESGVAVDLLLSLRDVKDWNGMVELVEAMPEPLRRTVLVQEQLGLALNRAGRGDEAEHVLTALIAERGESSETLGILGRVYKDRWDAAVTAGEKLAARGLLDRAIATYRRGFECDWRDHFPGINALTLMELREPPDLERTRIAPIVRYSVDRRIARGQADYWDWATLVELCVLQNDEPAA
ncbi:MAG: DUF4071 domain-containing protein, partial [Alphaproteobacteria bacterium]|nr:DUF4071 domain-containing protein [Alphaproteobacteria bacterium]